MKADTILDCSGCFDLDQFTDYLEANKTKDLGQY